MSENSNDKSNNDSTIWIDQGVDPMELIEKEKWAELTSYVEENIELLTGKLIANADDLADSVRAGAICLNIIDAMLKDKEMANAIYMIGKLKGMIELLARKMSHDSQQKEEEFFAELRKRLDI